MPSFKRHDGRIATDLRPIAITSNFIGTADGSCLIEMGGTRVVCTAVIVPGVPKWREKTGQGWMTAEYGMLPASTRERKPRTNVRPDGRSVEIQRLVGRTLRNVVRYDRLGENTIYLDCDVLEADGGTRTASINGSYVALALAADRLARAGKIHFGAVRGAVAAVSVGIVGGRPLLDLDYIEDSSAEVDFNVAMTGGGKFVEVQGSSERGPFSLWQLQQMLRLAARGIRRILLVQKKAIEGSR